MLTQRGTDRIEVIVRKEITSTGGKGAGETEAENTTSSRGEAGRASAASINRKNRIIKTNLTHALAVSKQVAGLVINDYISSISTSNGDQSLQDRVSRQIEQIQDTTNIASSISMGALYGSWGGPIGTVLGMTFGALSSGVSTWAKYSKREREYNFKTFKENNAIEYKRARAGINLTTGRLR